MRLANILLAPASRVAELILFDQVHAQPHHVIQWQPKRGFVRVWGQEQEIGKLRQVGCYFVSKPGNVAVAIYYPQLNKLYTRAGDPPMNLNARTSGEAPDGDDQFR